MLPLYVPIIWYPGSEDDQDDSIEKMVGRAFATRDLLRGVLDAETFLDMLEDEGFDIPGLVDAWEEGCSQLILPG